MSQNVVVAIELAAKQATGIPRKLNLTRIFLAASISGVTQEIKSRQRGAGTSTAGNRGGYELTLTLERRNATNIKDENLEIRQNLIEQSA